ncbi:hypothetical protein DFH06DRAFT_1338796 [Mycena polygramma]|nr:hypothetical protein DFH06DRAFT_1338796 [Mycena polygramma]
MHRRNSPPHLIRRDLFLPPPRNSRPSRTRELPQRSAASGIIDCRPLKPLMLLCVAACCVARTVPVHETIPRSNNSQKPFAPRALHYAVGLSCQNKHISAPFIARIADPSRRNQAKLDQAIAAMLAQKVYLLTIRMRVNTFISSLCILPFAYLVVATIPRSDVETFPSSGNTHLPGTLLPAKHPDKEVHDLNNLKATKGVTLYYEEPTASQSRAPMSAYVDVSAFKVPAVSVEHSVHIRSVSCEDPAGSHISVSFANLDAWKTAVDDWSQYPEGFYIIAYVDGCGPGAASGERSFHLVHSFTSDKNDLSITCDMETVKIHDAVHPEEKMSARMFQSGRASSAAHARDTVDDDLNMDEDPEQWLDKGSGYQDVPNAQWSARGDMLNKVLLSKDASKLVSPSAPSRRGFGDIDERTSLQLVSQAMVPYNTTPWGIASGYTLYSNTTKNANKGANGNTKTSTSSEFTFGLYCVQCHAELYLSFHIAIDWTVLNGISKAVVELNGKGEMQIVLGLEAHYKFKYDVKKALPIPKITPFQVPGVINFGPAFNVDIGATLTIDVQGRIAAGYTYEWDQISATLDLVNRERSTSSGWTPTETKHFAAEASVKVTFTPFIEFKLGIELAVLGAISDKLKIGIYIGDRISLELALALTVKADTSGITIGDAKCAGVTFSAKLKGQLFLVASAAKAEKKFNLYTHPVVDIADQCFKLAGVSASTTRAIGARQDGGPSPSFLASPPIDPTEAVVSLIVVGDGIGAVLESQAPDFYSKDAATYYTVRNDGEHTLVIFNDTLSTTGMSRCRMKAQNEIPMYGVFGAFAKLIDTASGTPYGMVVSELGVHWPVLCSNNDVLVLYLVNGKEGLENLLSNNFQDTFANGNITQCAYLNFTAQATIPSSDTSSSGDSMGGDSDSNSTTGASGGSESTPDPGDSMGGDGDSDSSNAATGDSGGSESTPDPSDSTGGDGDSSSSNSAAGDSGGSESTPDSSDSMGGDGDSDSSDSATGDSGGSESTPEASDSMGGDNDSGSSASNTGGSEATSDSSDSSGATSSSDPNGNDADTLPTDSGDAAAGDSDSPE